MQKPSYMKWLPERALKAVGNLGFLAHGVVEGFVAGRHRSARKGASTEFAEHRAYVPGDDLRTLDWKLVARRDRLYVKQFVDETNLRATIVLDSSASMAYVGDKAHGRLSKFDYARHLAAAIAYLLVNQQDAVGLMTFDGRAHAALPAKSQPAQMRLLLEKLDALAPAGETDAAAALHEIAERLPRRSVVFLLSDFYTEPAALLNALHHLRFRHHEVLALQVAAEEERTFPFERMKIFEDMESPLTLDVDARAIRQDYLARYARHQEDLARGCGEMRVTHERVETTQPFERALADILVRYREAAGGRR